MAGTNVNIGAIADFNKLQLLNIVIQNLSVPPSTVGLPSGFTYYSTSQNTVLTWTGSVWVDLGLAGVSNLSIGTLTGTNISVNNDNGTGIIIPSATTSAAGLLSNIDKSKLDSLIIGASVSSFSSGDLNPIFSTSVTNPSTTPALSFTLSTSNANSWFGNNTGSTGLPSYNNAGVLSKTDDTNVKLTLSGNYSTALLNNTGIAVSWSGSLSTARGGTGLTSLGTSNQILRVNTAGTGLEYFTPSYGLGSVTSVGLSAPSTLFNVTGSPITTSGTIALSLASQTAKTFFSAPNGASGTPIFRAILPSDIGTGTTNNSTFLRGDSTWFQLINDSTTTTSSTWSSSKIQSTITSSMVGGMHYKGGYNATTNTPNLTSPTVGTINLGDTYSVTTAGTFFSSTVEVGDFLIAEISNPSVETDWTILNKNIPAIVNASQTVYGITRYATTAEVNAGTATDLAISPKTLEDYMVANTGKYTQTFGDGTSTSFTITHNLDDLDVIYQFYEVSSGNSWNFAVIRTSNNALTVTTGNPPSVNQFKIVIRS